MNTATKYWPVVIREQDGRMHGDVIEGWSREDVPVLVAMLREANEEPYMHRLTVGAPARTWRTALVAAANMLSRTL